MQGLVGQGIWILFWVWWEVAVGFWDGENLISTLKDHSCCKWRSHYRREVTAVFQVGEDSGWNNSGKMNIGRNGQTGDLFWRQACWQTEWEMCSGKEQKLLGFLLKQLGIINWKGERMEKSSYEVGRVVTWRNRELHFIHSIWDNY